MSNKASNIAKNPKQDGYQRELASMVENFFDKKSALLAWSESLATRDKSASGGAIKIEIISNKELAQELHKPIIRNFNKRKIESLFIENIWGADLADMQLISKCNIGVRFLLCFIDIFSKYAWVIPLKHKKCIVNINTGIKFDYK